MFCTRCGSPIQPGDTVCARCGKIVDHPAPSQAAPPRVHPTAHPTAYPTAHPTAHPTAPAGGQSGGYSTHQSTHHADGYPEAHPGSPHAPSQMSYSHSHKISYHSSSGTGLKEWLELWRGANAYVKFAVIAFLLLALCGFIGFANNLNKAVAPRPPAPAAVAQAPAQPVIPTGPTFSEADSRLDSRKRDLTEAQKTAYWNSIEGTMVTWTGEVVSVSSERGGQISLKCNPRTWSSDVIVNLNGSQTNRLHLINKGQQVTVQGILRSYGMTGYRLDQGRVQNL